MSESQKRILIAEDNELNLKIAAQIIQDEGIYTEQALNGLEAVEKLKKSPENYFDLILMDIQMPVLNGYEAAKHIRRLSRQDAAKVPIIAMTAYTFPEDIIKIKQSGMNAYLAKPLDIEILCDMIDQWINTGKINNFKENVL